MGGRHANRALKRKESTMRYSRLILRHISLRAAAMVVLVAAATLMATTTGEAAASARTAPQAPTESMLLHRLTTCRAPPRSNPTPVPLHRACAHPSTPRGNLQ